MSALELLRSRNRYEEELPSGLKATIRLPRIRDCIIAGQVPLPVLKHLIEQSASNGDAPTVSMEEQEHMARFQDEIVRRSVVALDGEPVTLSPDDVQEFSQADYDFIVEFALREQTSPKAVSPA